MTREKSEAIPPYGAQARTKRESVQFFLKLLSLVLFVLSAGCMSTVHSYEGPTRGETELARVWTPHGAMLERVDGRAANQLTDLSASASWDHFVLPGKRHLQFTVSGSSRVEVSQDAATPVGSFTRWHVWTTLKPRHSYYFFVKEDGDLAARELNPSFKLVSPGWSGASVEYKEQEAVLPKAGVEHAFDVEKKECATRRGIPVMIPKVSGQPKRH